MGETMSETQDESADNETLSAELARLVAEYEKGGNDAAEAWNLIADFTICNSVAICDALERTMNAPPQDQPQLPRDQN